MVRLVFRCFVVWLGKSMTGPRIETVATERSLSVNLEALEHRSVQTRVVSN